MNSLSIRAKLNLLNIIALVFILALGLFAIYGLRQSAEVTREIGLNRMPSIVGLMDMSRGQLETRVRNRSVFVYADEQNAQAKFARQLEKKQDAYRQMEAGKRIYEPLPQVPEEMAPWKEFLDNYSQWLDANKKLDTILLQLTRNNDMETQKHLVQAFKAELDDEVDPLLQKTLKPLNLLVDINVKIANQYYETSAATISRQNTWIAASVAAAFLALALLGYMISRSIIGPLQTVKSAMKTIESTNDFTRPAEVATQDEIGETAQAFNSLIAKMDHAMFDILGKATKLDDSAKSLSAASGQVARSSEDQSEATASMAASVEEMSVSIDHVADNASQALELSESAGRISEEGGMVIRKTVDEMNAIGEVAKSTSAAIGTLGDRSAQISSIVSTIREVAEQTNLLALNAAIEAARAGEQGRGFAVVADEVRKLAERTSRSTEEIASMVANIQDGTVTAVTSMQGMLSKVDHGKALATQAGGYIAQIQTSTQHVKMAVQDISAALKEQSIASQIIAQNVEQVAQMTDENNAAAAATSHTATTLERLANEISSTIRQFKLSRQV